MVRRMLVLMLAAVAITAFYGVDVSIADEKGGEKVGIKLEAAPDVKTEAKAKASFVLDKASGSLKYKLEVENLQDVTMGHIHAVGDSGLPGPVLAWLYPVGGSAASLKEGKFTGTLAEAALTADQLAGPMKGKTPKEVYEMLEYGKAGVALHTKQNPKGELWGVAKKK
ncbi:MAG: CHRD domain-containing protein [Thermodesulfobacteriota bacterium]